ncbi:hypothetical protein CAPTEDRAFT_225837 [Capitella teleta]|uniref:PEST proteolytic signal-containing nuclear protein n=1 Tax=Capitella teleta TaxID=283909 RepID=R7UMW6_CAPTE|nr:hypothetical protein CAPTEDRAFT_225837 [Capitella teleta]|eukprot:ELU04602.1 hypothetical protein CAPTEDRAFT_225837 [Capitella teleta]
MAQMSLLLSLDPIMNIHKRLVFNMAEKEKEAHDRLSGVCDESHSCIKKRRFTDGKDESEPEVKRISASSLKPKLAVSAPAKSAGIMMALGSKKSKAPVKMALSSQKPKEPPVLKKASLAVSKAFAEESDVSKNMIVIENKVLVSQQSEEDMPPEAKMRMRNIGRDTPTASGPNSFGKSKLGFCDYNKLVERELEKQMDEIGDS